MNELPALPDSGHSPLNNGLPILSFALASLQRNCNEKVTKDGAFAILFLAFAETKL